MNPDQSMDERELIKGCRAQNRSSQEILYRQYAKIMYNICLSYTKDNEEAKDLLQDGFIKVFRNIKQFKGSGSLEGWIRRIITNTAIDYYKRTAKQDAFISIDQVSQKNLGDTIKADMETEDIISKIRRLPQGARIIFNLYAIEGFSHKEISEILKISEETSKSQVNRARMLLQNWLHEYGI